MILCGFTKLRTNSPPLDGEGVGVGCRDRTDVDEPPVKALTVRENEFSTVLCPTGLSPDILDRVDA
jgi:hypothetical protein